MCYQQVGRGWVRQRGNRKYVGVSGNRIRYFTPALAKVAEFFDQVKETDREKNRKEEKNENMCKRDDKMNKIGLNFEVYQGFIVMSATILFDQMSETVKERERVKEGKI